MATSASARPRLASRSPLASEGHLTPSSQARGLDRNYRSPAGFRLVRHGIETGRVPEYGPDSHRLRVSPSP